MNLPHRNTSNSLLDAIAENLLETGYSISFEKMNGLEFISASGHNAADVILLFLPFDPVRSNAADFLDILFLLKLQAGFRIQIIVAEEGERDILLNVFKKQEVKEAEVLCLAQLKYYPLQLT